MHLTELYKHKKSISSKVRKTKRILCQIYTVSVIWLYLITWICYEHSDVVYKEQFIKQNGKDSNYVESLWSKIKNWILSMPDCTSPNLIEFRSYVVLLS